MTLGTVTAAHDWVTLAQWDTYAPTVPARFRTRTSAMIAMIRSVPGCRNAARHFRHRMTVRTTITIFDEAPAQVYTHTLECTTSLYNILTAIPGANLKPEVRRM